MLKNIFIILLFLGGLFLNACDSKSDKVDSKAIYTEPDNEASTENSSSTLKATQTSLDTSSIPDDLLSLSDETEKLMYLVDSRGSRPLYTSINEALNDPENVFRLKLQGQNLNRLPNEITDLYNLEELYLSGNNLTALPDSFGVKLRGLRVLDLSNNNFQRLPDELGNLNNLAFLNLSSNRLSSLPVTINNLQGLQILNLENNAFRSIPTEVFQLSDLKYLFIQNVNLNTFPEEISQLGKLKRLSLVSCGLSEIPPAILSLTNLHRLNLARNQIKEIPNDISGLKEIYFLDVSNNQIQVVDPILSLTKLQHLNLGANPIETVPVDLYNRLNLKLLNLSYTQIQEVSTSISKFKNLVWFAVVGTPIQTLPASIGECKRLQVVELGQNSQLDLEQTFTVLELLPNLKALEIRNMTSGNSTLQLPAKILDLKKLVKLDLRGNNFSDMSGELDKFAQIINNGSLQALNLSRCGIRKADADFAKLSGLHVLGIDEKNMYNGEAVKLSQAIPNVQIVDGSDYFDYRF